MKKSFLNSTALLFLIAVNSYVQGAQEPNGCSKKIASTIAATLLACTVVTLLDHATSLTPQPYICDTSDICAPDGQTPHKTAYCAYIEGRHCLNRHFIPKLVNQKAYAVYTTTAHCPGNWIPLKEYEARGKQEAAIARIQSQKKHAKPQRGYHRLHKFKK